MGYVAGFYLIASIFAWMGIFMWLCIRFNPSSIDIGIGAALAVSIAVFALLIATKINT